MQKSLDFGLWKRKTWNLATVSLYHIFLLLYIYIRMLDINYHINFNLLSYVYHNVQ